VVAAVETGVTAVRGVGVVVSQVDPADIRLPDPPAPPTPVQYTEATQRLDAVASAGFRTSRAKMASLIRSGGVRLNWAPTTKGSAVVSAGDIIACSGKGRVEVVGVGLTAKGRWRVEMLRFV
jgi:RNA-binding protein YlmH